MIETTKRRPAVTKLACKWEISTGPFEAFASPGDGPGWSPRGLGRGWGC